VKMRISFLQPGFPGLFRSGGFFCCAIFGGFYLKILLFAILFYNETTRFRNFRDGPCVFKAIWPVGEEMFDDIDRLTMRVHLDESLHDVVWENKLRTGYQICTVSIPFLCLRIPPFAEVLLEGPLEPLPTLEVKGGWKLFQLRYNSAARSSGLLDCLLGHECSG